MQVHETNFLLLGLRIDEPITVLTNIFLSVFTFSFYYRVTQTAHKDDKLSLYWAYFFLFLGIANTIAAFTHGFKSYFEQDDYYYIWMFMNMAGIPSSYYLLLTNLEISEFSDKKRVWYYRASQIMTLALVITMFFLNNIGLVKLNAGIVILITLLVHFQTFRKGNPGSKLIFGGFAFSMLTILVHNLKLSLHDYFNYKDISHVIMNIGLYIIFLGVMQLSQSRLVPKEKAA